MRFRNNKMTSEKCMLRDLDLFCIVAVSVFQRKLSVVLLLEVLTLTVSSSFFIPCCDIFFSQFGIKTQVYMVHFYTQVLSEVNWLLIYLMLFFVVIEKQENMNFHNGISRPNLKTTWAKQAEVIKEPYMCSPLQNLLLYFPG